jgi:hypothetical protein
MTVSRELSIYRLDLVGLQEVRWQGSGTAPAGEYAFFYALGTGYFVHKRIISTVKKVQFVGDRMSYKILRVISERHN